jgi:hypothetical protein
MLFKAKKGKAFCFLPGKFYPFREPENADSRNPLFYYSAFSSKILFYFPKEFPREFFTCTPLSSCSRIRLRDCGFFWLFPVRRLLHTPSASASPPGSGS